MTLTKTTKRTAAARTSGPHRTKPTRRSIHRSQEPGARSQVGASARQALITVDGALLTEARDWAIFAGVSLVGWLAAAIVFGVV